MSGNISLENYSQTSQTRTHEGETHNKPNLVLPVMVLIGLVTAASGYHFWPEDGVPTTYQECLDLFRKDGPPEYIVEEEWEEIIKEMCAKMHPDTAPRPTIH